MTQEQDDGIQDSIERLIKYCVKKKDDQKGGEDNRIIAILEPPPDCTGEVKEEWKRISKDLLSEIPLLLIRLDQDPECNPFALLLRISERCDIWRPCDRDVSAVKIIEGLTSGR